MLRPVTRADRAALVRIAYATAYFGASADAFFPCPEVFARLWVDPYLTRAPGCGILAEDEGGAVGYVLGSMSWRGHDRRLVRTAPGALARLLATPAGARRSCLQYLTRLARHPTRLAPAAEYPAHLHLNVLPHARGRGLGTALLERHLACLAGRGVPGVQLSTTQENEAALRLYRRVGFVVASASESSLWEPWLGRSTTHLVMTKRLRP